MESFMLEIPTRIYYGRNTFEQAITSQTQFLHGNVMLVTTGRTLIKLGYVEQIKNALLSMDTISNVMVIDSIEANPKINEINKAISQGISNEIEAVIGFGGGSSIDAAKAIAVGIGNRRNIDEYFLNGTEPSSNTLPIIAIPTTAGTGSELSKAAILTDIEHLKKGGIRGTNLYPKAAIVDSSFTDSIPHKITMETGFDVLAHAIESYISKKATAFTRMLSENAIKIAGENLVKLNINLQDKEARDQMSYASTLMGINLGNASTCLPHRMQYPIGAHTDTSHGAGLAALFPAWLSLEYDYSEQAVKYVTHLLTKKDVNTKSEVKEAITDFLQELQLNYCLSQLGIKKNELESLSTEVTGNIMNDPAAIDENIIKDIYQLSF